MNFATVVEIQNPLEPWTDIKVQQVEAGCTIWEWMRRRFGEDFDQFETPTMVYYQGTPILRKDWNTVLKPGNILQLIKVVGDAVTIVIAIIAVVVAIVAVVLVVTMNPQAPGGQPQPDPVFTRQGQFNRLRPGEPIEVSYGRCRMWPSYAARPYNAFYGNDQFQYNLFCVGQGFYDIEGVFIEDTPIENFKEVEYEVIPPRGEMTMFPDNVETSVEVSNIELFGPNQEEYDGWSGPFVVNSVGTKANFIEVDIMYPGGLYKTKSSGKFTNASVEYEFQVQAIDGTTGDPLGDWTPIVEYVKLESTFANAKAYRNYMKQVHLGLLPVPPELIAVSTYTDTRRTSTPQRITRRFEVADGRYQIRGRRITNRNTTSGKTSDLLQWASLRAFLPSVKSYGDVTLLALKIRASNNINDNSRSRVNVVGTRMLPVWDPEVEIWSDEEVPFGEGLFATRSPVDAFLDIFRASYGGKLANRFLDIDGLMELKEELAERGDYFDWTFDQKTTLLEASNAAARVGRGITMMRGSLLHIVRDGIKTLPVTMFTPENIVKDSFRNDIKLFEFDGYDCVKIQYIDPDTWKEEQILCALPGSTTANPQVIKLSGCTNRAQAYREGMFIAANQRYTRENITFKTGLEGHIPLYGDLISVAHDVLDLQSYVGVVLEIWTNGFGKTVFELSESVAFARNDLELEENPDLRDRVIVLRKKDGSLAGPYVVTAGATQNQVIAGSNTEGAAHGTLTFTTTVEEGAVTMNGVTVEFGMDIDVGAGLTPEEAALALATYINAEPDFELQASVDGALLGVSSLNPGEAGNSIATTTDVAGATWGAATLENGEDIESPYYFDDFSERPIYLFGVQERAYQNCKVVNLTPDDENIVEVTCTPYNPIVHSFDELEPPDKDSPEVPPEVPALPEVADLNVVIDPNDASMLVVSWTPAYGAQYYVLEKSEDGDNWNEIISANVTSTKISVTPGDLWLRVAAVNTGAGAWTTWSGEVGVDGVVPGDPSGLVLLAAWTTDEFTVKWQPAVNANGYTVRIYASDGGLLVREEEVGISTSFTYDVDMAEEDGTVQNTYHVKVVAENPTGESAPAELDISNPAPSTATGMTSALVSGSIYQLNWDDSTAPDFAGYRVYASTTMGFTPGPSNKVYEGTASVYNLDTAGVTHYWRVETVDVWNGTSMTAEQTRTVP